MLNRLRIQFMRLNASVTVLGIVALAFGLRVYRLADKNIWWDEGWTIWLSRQDLGAIALRTASDEHPPLHYWLMHFWNLAAGTDAFVGRFFSLFFGVLTVALLYRIGKQVGGKWLGLLAALLLALARFNIWWSQDIKNYTLSGMFALASVWFVLRLVTAPLDKWKEWELWLGYILCITIALYTHYLAALIFLASNLFMLIVLLREWLARRSPLWLLVRWSLAQLAVLALYAPWLALYMQNAATWTAAPPFDFSLFLRLAATVFATGVTTYIEDDAAIVAVFTLLALVGALWIIIRGHHWNEDGERQGAAPGIKLGALYALLIVIVPPLLIYVLSLTPAAFFAPKIQARYLLLMLPAYMLLLALGIRFLAHGSRYIAVAALVLVVGAQSVVLSSYYQERVLNDEYSTLTQAINSFALPDDALVLNTDQEWPTLLYYLRSDRVWNWFGVPNGAKVDAAGAHRIAAEAEQYHGAWVVTIPDALDRDPEHRVEAELAKHWPKQYEQTFGDKRLTLYSDQTHNFKDVPQANFSPLSARADDFGNLLRLIGLDLPIHEAQPGDTVHVVTYWASQDVVDVHLKLAQGNGTPVADQTIPISIGAHERAGADLVIPPDSGGTDLNVVAQARLTSLRLGTIHVAPRQVEVDAAPLAQSLNYKFGASIRLVGLNLPQREAHAGNPVPLTLFWKTDQPVTTSYTIFVHLLGSQYNPAQNNFLWGQIDRLPVEGKLPSTAWSAGERIADPYTLPVDAHAPPGLYKLEVGLYDAANGQRLGVTDAAGKGAGDSVVVGQIDIN